MKLTQLAQNFANVTWPRWSRDETPSKYIDCGYNDLTDKHGLKADQVELLIKIFRETLRFDESVDVDIIPVGVDAVEETDAYADSLEKLGIPEEFPLKLSFLGPEARQACLKSKVETIGSISKIFPNAREAERPDNGYPQQLRELYSAVTYRDVQKLSNFLPVAPGIAGLSFVVAARHEVDALGEREVSSLATLFGYKPQKGKPSAPQFTTDVCKGMEKRLAERLNEHLGYFKEDKRRLEQRTQRDDPDAVDRFFKDLNDEKKIFVAARTAEVALGARETAIEDRGLGKKATRFLQSLFGRKS
ncbi:MAG: hypothetical protein ACOCVG_00365 [Verrucomicrobiota bacterium]